MSELEKFIETVRCSVGDDYLVHTLLEYNKSNFIYDDYTRECQNCVNCYFNKFNTLPHHTCSDFIHLSQLPKYRPSLFDKIKPQLSDYLLQYYPEYLI